MSTNEPIPCYLLEKVEAELLEDGNDFHRSPQKAIQLLDKITEILVYCLVTLNETRTEDQKYLLYRSLNKVLRFLSTMKLKDIYALLLSGPGERSIADVREKLVAISKKLEPYMYTFHELVSGFKTTNCVYSFSHQMVYTQIGHRIEILLDLLKKDWTDIKKWVPTDSMYMRSVWISLIIVSKENLVINREQIITQNIEDVHDNDYSHFKVSTWGIETEEKDKLDWSLNKTIERKYCPATYTLVNCHSIQTLLELAEHFQRAVFLRAIESSNVDYIFLMCKVLLTQAKQFVKELECNHVCELFTRVYSVLDFLLNFVAELKRDQKSIIKISKECTYIAKLSYFFKADIDFTDKDGVLYYNYVDILYKYFVLYIKPAGVSFPNWSFFFAKQLSSTVIHRASTPRHITIYHYSQWHDKFKTLIHLNTLNPEDPELSCDLCLNALNFTKLETIAIMENCDHVFCSGCLVEYMDRPDRPGMSFRCPKNGCIFVKGSFIQGIQFKNFLNDVCNFIEGLCENVESDEITSGSDISWSEGIHFIALIEKHLPQVYVTMPNKNYIDPDRTLDGVTSISMDDVSSEVTSEAGASLPLDGGESEPEVPKKVIPDDKEEVPRKVIPDDKEKV